MLRQPEWREALERRHNREAREAAAKFIGKMGLEDVFEKSGPWDVWDTLTFEPEITIKEGFRRFKYYNRTLAKRVGEHLDVGYVWGRQQIGTIHFHSLYRTRQGSKRCLTLKDFKGLPWCRGALPQRPGSIKDISEYMMKDLHDNWEMEVLCHRPKACRKTRCLVAPRPLLTPDELMHR